ncbi:MAG TPA: PIG-L family deacetylase [Thermodesulfobacteriota bacterium]|nr:PIG-L family deacetylase [Thermodesulfobacteriota bacterium]
MRKFISDLKQRWKDRPFTWSEVEDVFTDKLRLPAYGKVLLLGPHPDDPETVAITSRLLRYSGCDIWYAIASMSPSGVEDEYAKIWPENGFASLEEKKIEIRRREQTSASEMFGLSQGRLAFLGIEESKELNSPENLTRMRDHLLSVAPDIVIMPMGKDPNQTHAWVYQAFRECANDLALETEKPVVALYNEDPKTIEIGHDLFVLFGEEGANWKRELLGAHHSQQLRNMNTRGMSFDERILRMNHLSYQCLQEISLPADRSAKYAEVFEIELFDFSPLRANE